MGINNKVFKGTLFAMIFFVSHHVKSQSANNPPTNSFKDTYSSGTYLKCAYNADFSETYLTSTVNYGVKTGNSVRIQAGLTPAPITTPISAPLSTYCHIGNFSTGSFHAYVDPNYNLTGCSNLSYGNTIVWDNFYTGDGSIAREARPVNYQLYPRDANNKGNVVFSGTADGSTFSSVTFYTNKTDFNNVLTSYNITTVPIVNNRINFSLLINAELSEYQFSYVLNGAGGLWYTIADHVVCGDAYLLSGQSNASKSDISAAEKDSLLNAYGPSTPYGKYSRTLGDIYSTSGFSHSDDASGCWGLAIQYYIQNIYHVPTCLINGGVGGTLMPMHLPLPSAPDEVFYNPASFTYNNDDLRYKRFAHLNSRIYQAGLEKNINGIFWWQGDGGAYNDYAASFAPLYNLYTKYYPAFKKIYVAQIASWIEQQSGMLITSESQRTMPAMFPKMTVMPANGIGFHRNDQPEDACGRHYIYTYDDAIDPNHVGTPTVYTPIGNEIHHQFFGYREMAKRFFRLVEKDLYGKTTNVNDITAPNIQNAYISGNHVTLVFDQVISANPAYLDNLTNILSVIKFNTEFPFTLANPNPVQTPLIIPTYITKTNPVIINTSLKFDISSTTGVTAVSYAAGLQETQCDTNAPVVVDPDFPCYLRNSKGIAAFSFYNIGLVDNSNGTGRLIGSSGSSDVNGLVHSTSIYPNPFNDKVTIQTKDNLPVALIKIIDVSGRLVFEVDNTSEVTSFDLSFLKEGAYFVSVKDKEGKMENFKLIKTGNN